MFWDKAAKLYDFFENFYNGEVNHKLVVEVANMMDKEDRVLECACGTGMITKGIGPRCKELIATDFSDGMLKQAKKKCSNLPNVKIRREDIMNIKCKDGAFDKVVAGNVIHLLDEPYEALNELMRCCKKGGFVIIPTYVNNENAGKPGIFIQILEKLGANFKKQFDYSSYKEFFTNAGYVDVTYTIIEGKMPCAIAVIKK